MQQIKVSPLLTFAAGILVAALLFFSFRKCAKEEGAQINSDYYILTNQIQRMNKMVVLEQDYSSFQTHKSSAFKFGGYDVLPREMVLYTTAKAQVTYDLKKLDMKVDSANKKLIIREIPNAEIKIFPDVKIHFMDDYAINRFEQRELQGIMASAKKNMEKSVDKNKLRAEGRKQLMENLDEILVLAKALDYEIEDQTGLLQNLKL